VVETLGKSQWYLGVRGARTEVARRVLTERARNLCFELTRSRDSVAFRNGDLDVVAGCNGGRNGGVRTC
jgi:hypothetical protein